MSFEVDLTSLLDLKSGILLLVITHEQAERRQDTEKLLLAAGGAPFSYPADEISSASIGSVVYHDGDVDISVGGVFIAGPLGFTVGEVALMRQALLLLNDEKSFDRNDYTEKTWIGAPLSLEILDKDEK
jgi:hypothetical protein